MSSAEGNAADKASVAALLRQLVEDISTLLHLEISHARAEFLRTAAVMRRGIGLVAVGLIALAFATLMLLLAAMLGLALVMPEWLAALCVGLIAALVGVAMCQWGKTQVKLLGLTLPETRASLGRDKALLKREKND
jgi:uncharacterized membrane protein YqjE